MLDGMKIASQGMMAMMYQQDVLTNNLANVNTAGFQSSTAITKSFESELAGQMQGQGVEAVGGPNDGVPVLGIKTASKFQPGAAQATGNHTDFALGGNGFFTVKGPDGETRYTRNGNFTVNERGFLVTNDGSSVMGFSGPIQIPPGKQFKVDDLGNVSVDGQNIARLRVTEFNDINELYKVGNNAYKPKSPTNVGQITGNPQIKQGFLETSNVSVVKEMIKMMDIERAYESNEKVIQAEDQMLQKSIQEVGRVG